MQSEILKFEILRMSTRYNTKNKRIDKKLLVLPAICILMLR